MSRKVGLISLGCQKNLVDSETMLGALLAQGFELTVDMEVADLVLINTCTFIKDARDETELTINEFIQWKKGAPNRRIILAGCHVAREQERIFTLWPDVDGIVGVSNPTGLKKLINDIYNKKRNQVSYIGRQAKSIESNSPRILSTFSASSYLKIADGCNNHCSYCIIPEVRGGLKSRSLKALVREARELAGLGIKELNLIAQDVGAYGKDLAQSNLVQLLKKLTSIPELGWVRLLYVYPDHIDEELIRLVSKDKKICKYIDIPMQHVNDRILQLMNRRTTKQNLVRLIRDLRAGIPGIVIRSTFIIGFPQESEAEFEELLEFLREIRLDRVGFFTYSPEVGTPAVDFDGQIDEATKQERLRRAQQTQSQIMDEQNARLMGTVQLVLMDGPEQGRYFGQAPEIDGFILTDRPAGIGEWVEVKITEAQGPDFKGVILT